MPFIGQDWRSPGEVWIKTIEGWEPMKLLRKSHFVRHQQQNCSHDGKAPSSPSFGGSSSSLSSSAGSSSSSSSSTSMLLGSTADSDSENDTPTASCIILPSSDPVPVPGKHQKIKIRHCSGDSNLSFSSPSSYPSDDSHDETAGIVANIVQSLQRSSSQPIPIDILKESSNQIEIFHTQPYYRITTNPTREVQGSNIISDAFYKLDFCNSIRDIRRFAYVSKLLHLLITQNLTSLSGNATKALFWMLEEIAKQVASNKQNIHVIRELIVELREIVDKYLCWGRPLGSTSLWDNHLRTMERICEMTDAIEILPPADNGKPSWQELPEELIREILLRLSDYKDLKRSAEACERMHSLLNEERHIWKQLVKYHFTKDQLKWASSNFDKNENKKNKKFLPTTTPKTTKKLIKQEQDIKNNNNNVESIDWEQMFHFLRKKFGLKEEYADCLFLCRYCRCLFWKSKGHPCILENPDLTRQLVTRHQFPSSFLAKPTANSQNCLAQLLNANQIRINTQNHQQRPNLNRLPNNGRPPQPQEPVVVQNLPFFEHPLVIQQQRANNNNDESNNNNSNGTTPPGFQKAPLHVPITPQAFLKFFSL